MSTSTITAYYNRSDLKNFKGDNYDTVEPTALVYGSSQTTILYSDSSLTTPFGVAAFTISIINTPNPASPTTNISIDTELGYYFINSGSITGCIFFNVANLGSTTPGYAPVGSNIRQITGGSGGFLGATGSITLNVNNTTGLRTVTINYSVPV
jgi:hypothetical protein